MRPISFFLESMAKRSDILKKFCPMMWRCMVHNFGASARRAREAGEEVGHDLRHALETLMEAGVQDGAGIPVVSVLLGCDAFDLPGHASSAYSRWALSSALECLKTMLSRADSQDDGLNLLYRLLSSVEREAPWTTNTSYASPPPCNIVLPTLFDGSLLDANGPDAITAIERSAFVVEEYSRAYGVENVRCLSEGEIEQFWDGFVECWRMVVDTRFENRMSGRIEGHHLPVSPMNLQRFATAEFPAFTSTAIPARCRSILAMFAVRAFPYIEQKPTTSRISTGSFSLGVLRCRISPRQIEGPESRSTNA